MLTGTAFARNRTLTSVAGTRLAPGRRCELKTAIFNNSSAASSWHRNGFDVQTVSLWFNYFGPWPSHKNILGTFFLQYHTQITVVWGEQMRRIVRDSAFYPRAGGRRRGLFLVSLPAWDSRRWCEGKQHSASRSWYSLSLMPSSQGCRFRTHRYIVQIGTNNALTRARAWQRLDHETESLKIRFRITLRYGFRLSTDWIPPWLRCVPGHGLLAS